MNIPAANGALFASQSPVKRPSQKDYFAPSSQQTLVQYVGSAPPKHSGLHRYVFVLYKYKGERDFSSFTKIGLTGNGRAKFKVEDFAHQYNLGKLPVALAAFEAEYDDHVPVVYAMLK